MIYSLRSVFPIALTLVMLFVLLSLGFWQVDRLAWKEDLLARIQARQEAPPLRISDAADIKQLNEASHAYRRAVLIGRFGAEQLFWFTQIENEPQGLPRRDAAGYHVLVPFILADGSAMLVDRGFVPARLKDTPTANPQDFRSLPVILRWPDRRGRFDNDDKPQKGLVYVRDGPVIGRYWQRELPRVIGESTEIGEHWPRGGQTRMKMSNNHLQYAGTWFGLAIVLVIVSGLWHIRFWKTRHIASEARAGDKSR